MTIKPLIDRVVLKLDTAEQTTASGIVLSSQAQEKPQYANVVAVGPGGFVDGNEVKMYVNVGDKVYFADNGELFGTVMSESENVNALSITPASKHFTDSKGNVVEVFYPGDTRIDVKGRIECTGYYNDEGGFTVDGRKYLAPGQTVNIQTDLVTVTITVTDIDLIEE